MPSPDTLNRFVAAVQATPLFRAIDESHAPGAATRRPGEPVMYEPFFQSPAQLMEAA